MSHAEAGTWMTTEQMLALPENGVERDLIRGELREKPMTRRNRHHSSVESRIAAYLVAWLDTQPEPRGRIVSGEAGFRLARNPDIAVGIDVAYVSADVANVNPDGVFFEGAPVLAVEILSPSDKQEEIDEKVSVYLETGVKLIWIVHPKFRTVTIYRPDALPLLVNEKQIIQGEVHLPGFAVEAGLLFQ